MNCMVSVLVATVISMSLARAADVSVEVYMTSTAGGEGETSFTPDTAKLFAIFKTKGIKDGDKVRGVLIAEDVGDVAPPNTKVLEKTLALNEDTADGDFNFSKPTTGWPVGKYRLEIYVNDDLATTAKFTIKAAGETEKASEESAETPDEGELKSMTESSLISFGRAVKKKDFSELYEKIASVWQKQTTPEKLETAFKTFLDKQIDLLSAIKGMEPVFSRPPAIDSNGVLVVKGYYPTKPNRIIFELKYLDEEGGWKLVGIDVNLKE
jgi:hypothetical protein